MTNLESEFTLGLITYFGHNLHAHTLAQHTRREYRSKVIPDGEEIPPNYKAVRFYEQDQIVIPSFTTSIGEVYEGIHTHDLKASSFLNGIPIKYRKVT